MRAVKATSLTPTETFAPEVALDRETPSFGDVMGAAWRTENDIYAMWQMMNRPDFEPEDGFESFEYGKGRPLWATNWESLSQAQSAEEFTFIENKIMQEMKDRETVMSGGTTQGLIAGMVAGLISPTALIPLTTQAKGAKGIRDAFLLAGAATTAQEAVLFAGQETRTVEEVGFGIAGGTILGGMLGSAAVYLKTGGVERAVDDMAGSPRVGAIQYDSPPSSLSPLPDDNFIPLTEAALPAPRNYLRKDTYVGEDTTFLSATSTTPINAPRMPKLDLPERVVSPIQARAREIDPDTIGQYDALVTRKQALAAQLEEAQATRRTDIDELEMKLTKEVDRLSGEVKTVKGKNAKSKLRAKIREMKADLETVKAEKAVAEDTNTGLLRQHIMDTDIAMRDLAPKVSAVYRKVKQDFPDLEAELPKVRDAYIKGESVVEELPEAPTHGGGGQRGVGAATSGAQVHGIHPGPNAVTKTIVNTLAGISGVGRTLKQQVSGEARNLMAKLHPGGMFLDTRVDPTEAFDAPVNQFPQPAYSGGSVAERIEVHTKALADFIQEVDDSYARHVFEGLDEDKLHSSVKADILSGVKRLPEGKLSRPDFYTKVYDAHNTQETLDIAGGKEALKALDKFYAYFKKLHDEVYEEVKLNYGADMQPVIPENANLGQGVEAYINHVFDITKINEGGSKFHDLLVEYGIRHMNARFAKEYGKLSKARTTMRDEIGVLTMRNKELGKYTKGLKDRIGQIEQTPDYVEGTKHLAELRAQLRAAGESPEAVKAALKEARENLGAKFNDLQAEHKRFKENLSQAETIAQMKRRQRNSRVSNLERKLLKLEDEFEGRWRKKGATGEGLLRGEADFFDQATDDAMKIQHNIRGNRNRVAGMDILGGERGPELARTLDMAYADKQQFLTKDLEYLSRVYARHMASDMELWRATGSVNGARALEKVADDLAAAEQRIMNAETFTTGVGKWNKEVPATPELRAKRLAKFQQQSKQIMEDFQVVISRLRHQRGANMDTDSWTYRLGNFALNVNVGRSMGNVVLSSVADVARPIMMFGLLNTFRHGWAPFVKGLTRIKAAREELMRFGIGLDPLLHNRTQAVFELMDVQPGKQTIVEKSAQFAANKIGFVAMFDRWTAEMKFIAGNVAIGTVSDAMRLVAKGGSSKRVQWARTLLADGGIDTHMAERIQKQFDLPGGSVTFDDGFQLPNTKEWTDMEAVNAYRSMVNKFTNDAIITPGPDRPTWMDASIGHRLLAQFRTFSMVSTNRTMVRGLQQSDMAVLNGVMVSLAMGAISYYTWAMTTGGRAKEEMLAGDLKNWAYQAGARSGLYAVFSEAQRIGETIPGLQQMAIFGGQSARTRQPTGLMGALAGPTFDLAKKMSNVVMGMDEPTQSTLHQARTMAYYQNVFYIKWLFNQVEEGLADTLSLPERRGD